MFYSNNSRVEHDYYNSYQTKGKSDESVLNIVIKVLFILFLITLIIAGYIFITEERKASQNPLVEQRVGYEIREEPLVMESETESLKARQLSTAEITQIVQVVMTQLDSVEKKTESNDAPKPLKQQVVVQDDDSFVKALMSESVEEKIQAQPTSKNQLALKDVNHYNKVVLSADTNLNASEASDDSHVDLSTELDDALGMVMQSNEPSSNYTRMISREIDVRSNEMRVIVVQRGDTLSKIAYRAYGDYDAYPRIFAANPEVIHNPNQIFVGQRLRIPL